MLPMAPPRSSPRTRKPSKETCYQRDDGIHSIVTTSQRRKNGIVVYFHDGGTVLYSIAAHSVRSARFRRFIPLYHNKRLPFVCGILYTVQPCVAWSVVEERGWLSRVGLGAAYGGSRCKRGRSSHFCIVQRQIILHRGGSRRKKMGRRFRFFFVLCAGSCFSI